MATTASPTRTFLLGRRRAQWSSCFAPLHPEFLSSYSQMCQYISRAGKDALLISDQAQLIRDLLQCAPRPVRSLGDALLLYTPNVAHIPVLSEYFRHAVFGDSENFLPLEELGEVLADDRKADLVIGGIVDHELKIITLWRGSFEPLSVPFSAFTPSGSGVAPDFNKFRVTDYGQTIQLGPYEAATESLLYEFDPDYRRRIGRERRESEQSFGAALRRLRKQRGLRREDFAPLSAKTIARIEQGKESLDHLHTRTRGILSQKLGVKAEEIGTF